MDYKYDVALSFAGEDREYVDEVAEILKANGAKVFYDRFETIDLWGKDLGTHFEYVYRRSARYCIPFISKHYKAKMWTNYEIKNAISRAIEQNEDYILPVRFDNTELDGLRPTLGYVDAIHLTPSDLALMILTKLSKQPTVSVVEMNQPEGKVHLTSNLHFMTNHEVTGCSLSVTVTNTIKEVRYFNSPLFRLSEPLDGTNDTFWLDGLMENISFPIKLEYGQPFTATFALKKGFLKSLKKFEGQNVTIEAIVATSLGERYMSNAYAVDDVLKYMNNYLDDHEIYL